MAVQDSEFSRIRNKVLNSENNIASVSSSLGSLTTFVAGLTGGTTNFATRPEVTGALSNRPTRTEVTGALSNRPTRTEVTGAVSSFPTRSEVTGAISVFPARTEVTGAVSSFPTRTEVTGALVPYAKSSDVSSSFARLDAISNIFSGDIQISGNTVLGNNLVDTVVINATMNAKSDVLIDSKLTVNGNTVLGNAPSDRINITGTLFAGSASIGAGLTPDTYYTIRIGSGLGTAMEVWANIEPFSNNNYNLGSSTFSWKTLYINDVNTYGNLVVSGNTFLGNNSSDIVTISGTVKALEPTSTFAGTASFATLANDSSMLGNYPANTYIRNNFVNNFQSQQNFLDDISVTKTASIAGPLSGSQAEFTKYLKVGDSALNGGTTRIYGTFNTYGNSTLGDSSTLDIATINSILTASGDITFGSARTNLINYTGNTSSLNEGGMRYRIGNRDILYLSNSVGIGTSTPKTGYTLDVNGSGSFRSDLEVTGNLSTFEIINGVSNINLFSGSTWVFPSGVKIKRDRFVSSNNDLAIRSDGRVEIGGPAPGGFTQKLYISGSVSTHAYGTGSFQVLTPVSDIIYSSLGGKVFSGVLHNGQIGYSYVPWSFATIKDIRIGHLSGADDINGRLGAKVEGDLGFEGDSGIIFNVNAAPSSLLNDYEEGTWTPEFGTDGATQPSISYSIQKGSYVKIGKLVTISGEILISLITVTGVGNITIKGLPFDVNSNYTYYHSGVVSYYEYVGTFSTIIRVLATSGTAGNSILTIRYAAGSAIPSTNLQGGFTTPGTRMVFSVTYRTVT